MTASTILDYAIKELKNLQDGEEFTLKDLYKGYEWKRIKVGDRSKIGTLFLNYAETQSNIEICQDKNGQKYYVFKCK